MDTLRLLSSASFPIFTHISFRMQTILKSTLLALLTLILANGCNRAKKIPDTLDANLITFQVNYLDSKAGDIPTSWLPDKMEATYTNYFVMTRIEGFMGQFTLAHIADLKENTVTTLLNFLGTKVFHRGNPGELPVGIHPLADPNVIITGDTLTICGLTSEKAIVNTDGGSYDIYYTDKFNVKQPNLATPYPMIDHVLTDFRVQLSVLKMHLRMQNFTSDSVSSTIFIVPENFKEVSREEMETIINSLFTKD